VQRQPAFIPNGFPLGDFWVRQAEIRQLNGYDEQLLAQTSSLSPFFRTTLLLERVVTFGELTVKLEPHETIRNLTLGDRIALILQVRKAVFGEKIQAVLKCPICKEALSLDFSVRSLLQPAKPSPKTAYTVEFENFVFIVKAVTGADLELVASVQDGENPQEQLARICIISSTPPLPEKLSDELILAVSLKLQEIDPQADIVLSITCPKCIQPFQVPLDIEDYFFKEITARLKQLEREIHWIALNYHWSEDAILSLPVSKRKRYIELINASLAGESV
jgi:hypothetical protein